MDRLSVIASCDGCGACCMSQSSPPGYAKIVAGTGAECEADVARVAALPLEARAALVEFMKDSDARLGTPCCWFDMETRNCRYYEYRPAFCRHGKEHPYCEQPEGDESHEQAPWIYPGNANCVEWRGIFADEIELSATGR